ncbi:MAG: glycosyltransferase family 2 protein [Desulfobacterales bacterium]|nr:glycosyltransferase family 2 protein [Desulfobacterales bacterium]
MDVSIIIVNWNTKKLLLDCIRSIHETVKNISFEIWLVDNASIDGSVEAVKQNYSDVKIIQNNKNLGFAAANNVALERMRGRYALLLNTDTILTNGSVEALFDFMKKNSDAGMACGQLLNQDGSKQNSVANFPGLHSLVFNESLLQILFPRKFPGKRREYKKPVEVDSCIGACLMVRKKAMDEVGLLDKRYFFFFEETDWAYRMKQDGWKIYFVPSAKIFHIQGQTVGHNAGSRVMFYRSRYIYFKKWHKNSYPLIRFIIFVRLLINTILSLAGVVATIGMHAGIKKKLSVYSRLILWHLVGCPEDR